MGVNVERVLGVVREEIVGGVWLGEEKSKNGRDENEGWRERGCLVGGGLMSKVGEVGGIVGRCV